MEASSAPAGEELRQLRSTLWGEPQNERGATGARRRSVRARSAGIARFGIVGVSGIVVNEAAIALLVSGLGLHYVVGYLLSTQFSTLWNFAFIETWAFRTASPTNRRWHRFVMLMFVNNVANVLTAPLYVAFTRVFGISYLISNLLTLAIVFLGRFLVAERIWGGRVTATKPQPDAHDGGSGSVADLLQRHADSVATARAGGRRFATSRARRAMHDALLTERTALQHLGYDSFAEFLAGDAPPARNGLAEQEELVMLRERVAALASELAEARASLAVDSAPQGPVVSTSRHERRQSSGERRATSGKWFPAG